MTRSILATAIVAAVGASCTHSGPPPPLTRDRERESLEQAVRWKNPNVTAVMMLAGKYTAAHRNREGYEYFEARSKESPDNMVFVALAGMFQARLAPEVPLLSRVSWVEQAIAKLDRAAAADGLPRYLRGLVFVELPQRFGRTQQGVQDLEAMLSNADKFPPGLRRGAWRGIALGQALLGHTDKAEEARRNGGGSDTLLTDFSVSAAAGFRFAPPELVQVGENVFVVRGYDFADIAFVVTSAGLVAIDAGTTPATAAQALAAMQTRVDLPIRAVIVTHSHWDHIGGLSAFAGPGVEVIAQSQFSAELALIKSVGVPFHFFFGTGALGTGAYTLTPQRVIASQETVRVGDKRFVLVPVHGGETEDALLIHLPDAKITFVGDAFMPYFGAPFVGEGSVEGLFHTIEKILALGPTGLIHGHTPLTMNFTYEILLPLESALASVRDAALASIREGRAMPEILNGNLMPPSLSEHPDAVVPFLLMRDNLIQRLHLQRVGYWKPDGEGMEVFTRAELARAVDLLGGGREQAFVQSTATLNERGDFAMALRMADWGLAAHPQSAAIASERRHALEGLQATYQFNNPFKFIIYSEMMGEEVHPVPGYASALADTASRPQPSTGGSGEARAEPRGDGGTL